MDALASGTFNHNTKIRPKFRRSLMLVCVTLAIHTCKTGRSPLYTQTENALVHAEDVVSKRLEPRISADVTDVVGRVWHNDAYKSKQARQDTELGEKMLLNNEVRAVIDQKFSDEGEGASMLLDSKVVGLKNPEDLTTVMRRQFELAGWPELPKKSTMKSLNERATVHSSVRRSRATSCRKT